MSDAPERIWAGNWLADVGETTTWDIGEWRDGPWPTVGVVEYVRADRIEELEAKLAKAVGVLDVLHANVIHAWPSLAGLGPIENARTTLAELKGQNDEGH